LKFLQDKKERDHKRLEILKLFDEMLTLQIENQDISISINKRKRNIDRMKEIRKILREIRGY